MFYNCTTGINVEGASGNYVIENNVAVNNATGAPVNPTPGVANRATGATGTSGCGTPRRQPPRQHNLVWQTGTGVEYRWNGTSYATQAALFAATGQEAGGLFADPKFANPAGTTSS